MQQWNKKMRSLISRLGEAFDAMLDKSYGNFLMIPLKEIWIFWIHGEKTEIKSESVKF